MSQNPPLYGKIFAIVFAIAAITRADSVSPPPPPPTPMHPVIDNYFTQKITDPYRWLEDLQNPEVQSWFKAQADYADAILNHLPTRSAFKEAITKYVNSEPASVGDIDRLPGGNYFFIKTLPTDNTGKLYHRTGIDGPDTLLIDTDQFTGPHGQTAAINYYTPSYDSHYVVAGISVGGSEAATIHILDTQTGKMLPETVDRAEFGDIAWLPDNQSFCYVRLKKLTPGEPAEDKYLDSTVYLHRLGTSIDHDPIIMQRGLSGLVPMQPVDGPFVLFQPESKYVLGVVEHGVQNEHTLYTAPLDSISKPNIPWQKVCDVEDDVTGFNMYHDDLFLMTHKDAPHFKLIKTSMEKPDLASAKVVIPNSDDVLREFTIAGDAVYARMVKGGLAHVLRAPYDGSAPKAIPMPFEGDVGIESTDSRLPGVLLAIGSWTRGNQVYEFDPAAGKTIHTNLQPAGPYDQRDDLTSVEVEAPSWDGALVPLSIIYKKGLKLDGNNPVCMLAYGAYGITMDSGFSPSFQAWLDRGGIDAIAHVRGGGENGEDWYKAGYKLTKPNTWRDLIACAQYLIDHKYSSPAKLGIVSGSAGGITLGRAITARPDLFAAANIRAGAVDTLRAEHSSNGVTNIPEFGSVTTEEGFEDLLAMDAYQHVQDNTPYPGVILTIGMNDPRVDPWESAKFTARLQAATTSNRPILLRVDFKGGHGIGASKAQRINQQADMFAFFWDQFGLK